MRQAIAFHLSELRAAWPFLVRAGPRRSPDAPSVQKLHDSLSAQLPFLIASAWPHSRILDIPHGGAFAGGYG
jgi:hypothetical protein